MSPDAATKLIAELEAAREALAQTLPDTAVLERIDAAIAEARQPPEPTDEAVDVLMMHEACRRNGHAVTWDGFIDTAGAAFLLGKTSERLRRWREEKRGPPYHKETGRSAHCRYSLAELHRWRRNYFERVAE